LCIWDSWLLTRLYADADQRADLRALLDRYDKVREAYPLYNPCWPSPTLYTRELLRIQDLAAKKDVPALVALCQKRRPTDRGSELEYEDELFCSAAAEALAGLGGPEVEAIKSALNNKPKVTSWLLYALGRSRAAGALEALKDLAGRDPGDDRDFSDCLAYALALQGEPGKQILKRLAEQDPEKNRAARRWLEEKAQPVWLEVPGPRVKAGSLPKSLPEVPK